LVALQGVFGVHRPGSIEAIFFDRHTVILPQQKLQDVDPRLAVRLNRVTDLPKGSYRVKLGAGNAVGENLGFLGKRLAAMGIGGRDG
jgi:hypothetical protein